MSDASVNYIINISGNATANLQTVAGKASAATVKIGGLRSSLSRMGESLFALNQISDAFGRISSAIDQAIQPGIAYDSQLTELSAIAGVTGDKLKEIGGYARENAKIFGGSAGKSVESYKLLLSQLGPSIAETPEALEAMGKSVSVLSKTLGNDPAAATAVLTAAMNQYQVSLDDPMQASAKMAEMMNVMAAAAREGSAELPYIKAAVENSGMAAKMAGVSFEELNAAIQVLDKAGKRGAEGGVAIRNTLAILSQGRFLEKAVGGELEAAGINIEALGDTSVSLIDRLKMLKPVMNDTALITKMFGRENQNAALALISGTDEIDRYTGAVTGTNAAQEQAGIIMGSFAERMSRIRARIDDLKISFFNIAQGALPAVQFSVMSLQGVMTTLTLINSIAAIGETSLAQAISHRSKKTWEAVTSTWSLVYAGGTWMGMSFLAAGATMVLTASVKALGKAIYNVPIIGWIALGISLLVGLFKMLWDRSEKFRQILFGIGEVVKMVFNWIGRVISNIWTNIVKPVFMAYYNVWKWVITTIWDGIVWVWDGIKSVFGSIASWLNDNLLQPIKNIFGGLWDFVGKILDKIIDKLATPLRWIKNLWNKIFPKDAFKDVADAYEKGVEKGTESWQKSQKNKQGIEVPAIAGLPTAGGGNVAGGSNAATGGGATVGKTNSAIAQGGTRNTEININFRNMVETITFSGGLKENAQNLRRQVEEVMMQVLNQARATA
jgi:TP901 family phage tail tape measure protein